MPLQIAGVKIVAVTCQELEDQPGSYRLSCRLAPQVVIDGRYQTISNDDELLLRSKRLASPWCADFSTILGLSLGPEGQAPPALDLGTQVVRWAAEQQAAAAEEWVGRDPIEEMAREARAAE